MLTNFRIQNRAGRGFPAILAAAAVFFSAGAASPARPSEPIVAITGGTVLSMAGAPLESGTVLIRNGRIAAVGRNVKVPKGATVVDARGKFVMPGIVDAMTFFGTRPFVPNVPEPVTPENKIIDAYRPYGEPLRGPGGVQAEPELLCGGVTTIYIAPGSAQLVGGQGAVVKTAGADFDSVVLREPASVDMAIAYTPLGAIFGPALAFELPRLSPQDPYRRPGLSEEPGRLRQEAPQGTREGRPAFARPRQGRSRASHRRGDPGPYRGRPSGGHPERRRDRRRVRPRARHRRRPRGPEGPRLPGFAEGPGRPGAGFPSPGLRPPGRPRGSPRPGGCEARGMADRSGREGRHLQPVRG